MGLFNLFKKKNNEIHAEENKKEELEKLRLEKKVSLAEKEKMMCQLREQIIAEINETPAANW